MRRADLHDDRGQTLIVVAIMLTALFGFTGLAADIGWYELNMVRVQHAADAAALAGVVYLPGNVSGAVTAAQNEAAKNGFANGIGGVTVTAAPEPLSRVVLGVTISSPVRTFFARIFGVTSFTARRNARAEFVLPVPMGSPEDYYGINVLCRNSDTPPNCPQAPSADGIGTLAPLGFFGGVEARGTDRSNGDAYSTYYNGTPALNSGFDANGYSYIVDFPAGTTGGSVYLFDPIFCATGGQTSTGTRLGVGDYWFPSGTGGVGITTVYNLWDLNGTPYATSDDILMATSGTLFANSNAVDKGPLYKGNSVYGQYYYGASSTDCQSNPYHNRWWRLASGLSDGQYRVQAVTSSGANNEVAINGFGIQVTSTGGAGGRVYGQSRMCAFIVINNTSVFYLAQVGAAHAGKVLEIKLFDPGDITNTTLRIRVPTRTGFTYASFTWTATGSSGGAPTSGGPTTSLTTSNSTTNFYNNQWVTILVAIPTTYAAPTPPGEPGPGWWKIEYNTGTTGADITTWEVNIRGNPVHLITPY
jgi:putative Flp pilus-assembly TadE/G-like protein